VPPLAKLSEHMNERSHAGNKPKPAKRVPAAEASSDERNPSIWVDVDEERPRRRRRPRQPTSESSKPDRSTKTKHQSSSQLDLGRFLPKLSRILEATDPNVRQRSYHGNEQKRDAEEKTRSTRYRDENDYVHRHPAKRRTTVIPRRSDTLPNFNPSLLSVLSGLTSASDRSSGSNSTITQSRYDRKRGLPTRTRSGRPETIPETTPKAMSHTKPLNVFDYIEEPSVTKDHDEASVTSPASSSSSHYQPSDAGSSEAPPTPSSRSTVPSPTTNRSVSVSVAELRRKYDPESPVAKMPYSNSRNIEPSTRGQRKQQRRKDADEHMAEQGTASPSTSPSVPDFGSSHRQSSHGSLRALDDEQRLRQQEEDRRRHMAQSQHPYAYRYVPPPEPSDSHDADHAMPSEHQSLEHYIHQPVPMRHTPPRVIQPVPSPITNSNSPLVSPPHVPDAPDLTKTTLAGYELIASSLAASHAPPTDGTTTTGPTLTPLYRKFSHLHHRVLLHLQDELAELESQLRFLDESIAQISAASPLPPTADSPTPQSPPSYPPPSRRLERNHNYPHFTHRTVILGEIYNKQKQYHSALRDYTSMLRDSRPAEESEVAAYKSFMAERKPIWEAETKFLDRTDDLVVPEPQSQSRPLTRRTRSGDPPAQSTLWEQAAFLAALLLLPLLLSIILSDFASRAAATALLGAGAGLVIWGGRVREGV
jgi:hypothetical protein